MDNRNITLMIGAFLALILGIAFLTTIAGEEQSKTTQLGIDNESIAMADALEGTTGPGVNVTSRLICVF